MNATGELKPHPATEIKGELLAPETKSPSKVDLGSIAYHTHRCHLKSLLLVRGPMSDQRACGTTPPFLPLHRVVDPITR